MEKLSETIEFMQSADYKDRFKAEYYQLKIRMESLSRMLEKYKKGTLDFKPTCSYDMLNLQLSVMNSYILALSQRAEVEGIEL